MGECSLCLPLEIKMLVLLLLFYYYYLFVLTDGQPLDITLFSRGCSNSSSVAGCYDIQVDTDIVSAAMGDIAPFMSMIHGGVCFCDDADSCNTKVSSELHDIPYQSTTMKRKNNSLLYDKYITL